MPTENCQSNPFSKSNINGLEASVSENNKLTYAVSSEIEKAELAKFVSIKADDETITALISENYSLNQFTLQERLQAKKVEVNKIDNLKLTELLDSKFLLDKILSDFNDKIRVKDNFNNSLIMTTKEIKKRRNVDVFDFKLTPLFKATKESVSPVSQSLVFEDQESCFFGISLENNNFIRPKLLSSLKWISDRFSKCTVLIGDSIHRITIQTRQNVESDNALEQALTLGKKFTFNEESSFKRFSDKTEFQFIYCSEIQSSQDYKQYYLQLRKLYNEDEKFKDSVRHFGISYNKKRLKRGEIDESVFWETVEASSTYFLEEFAIFCCLQSQGLNVFIYPGTFSTLKEIADGKFPKAPIELQNLTVVSLLLKKR